MTNLDKLCDKLFNGPRLVKNIKFFPRETGDSLNIEEVCASILYAIEAVERGEGRPVDLSI
jgi:hypothetical protein